MNAVADGGTIEIVSEAKPSWIRVQICNTGSGASNEVAQEVSIPLFAANQNNAHEEPDDVTVELIHLKSLRKQGATSNIRNSGLATVPPSGISLCATADRSKPHRPYTESPVLLYF